MKALTSLQEQVLEFIKESCLVNNIPPTVHEIAVHMGYRSDNAAYQHLQALERKGFIELNGLSRGIELLVPIGIPIVGQVAAGAPILAEENIEDHVPIQHDLFKPKADYLLRVKGDSMVDAGIHDGDLLAVRKTKTAKDKEIVVARIDDEVTVKRFKRKEHIVTLQPENTKYKPIRVDLRKQSLAIEGVMCGLIRGSRR